jgi:hypothetical protein
MCGKLVSGSTQKRSSIPSSSSVTSHECNSCRAAPQPCPPGRMPAEPCAGGRLAESPSPNVPGRLAGLDRRRPEQMQPAASRDHFFSRWISDGSADRRKVRICSSRQQRRRAVVVTTSFQRWFLAAIFPPFPGFHARHQNVTKFVTNLVNRPKSGIYGRGHPPATDSRRSRG